MKKIFKFIVILLVTLPMYYSCETTEMELLTSPNALSPDQADPNFLLNKVQVDYVNNMHMFNRTGGRLSRIQQSPARNYVSSFDPNFTLSTEWSRLYSRMIPDIQTIESLNSADRDLSFQVGMAKILEAHQLMLFVDYFGDVIFSEAGNPTDFPAPKLDSGESVYQGAIQMLDDAIAMLTQNAPADVVDMFYNGDYTKWVKLANTLKMRAALTTGDYASVLNATDFISSPADDFVFQYGTKETNPDTRHPYYTDSYRSDGANTYQSNWLMNLMASDLGTSSDPRRRYYFYRQTWATPGNIAFFTDVNDLLGGGAGVIYTFTADSDPVSLACSVADTPPHLQFTPDENIWCSLPYGYWGRTHGDDGGIPPDNFTRTAPGVYPAGGSFDWQSDFYPYVGDFPVWGQQVAPGQGGGGAGIQPIILSSYVKFWLAEANTHLGNYTAAAANLQDALTESINKVTGFGSLDASADFTNAPTATNISDFIAFKVNEYTVAPSTSSIDGNGYPVAKDKLDVLGEQFFVTMYGGGADGFNFYRRTGHPRTLARNIDPNPGNFPRTFLYPSDESISNTNVSQKPNLDVLTFWDSGVTNPAN